MAHPIHRGKRRLALCHVEDLGPAIAELARVTRPGGDLVLSDMHPFFALLGGMAAFPTDDPSELSFVIDHHHPVSSFLAAFRVAGLDVVDCIEPTFDDQIEKLAPPPLHAALRQGLAGAPWALVWHLRAT
jgi:SAM-dependent methyltransferase